MRTYKENQDHKKLIVDKIISDLETKLKSKSKIVPLSELLSDESAKTSLDPEMEKEWFDKNVANTYTPYHSNEELPENDQFEKAWGIK